MNELPGRMLVDQRELVMQIPTAFQGLFKPARYKAYWGGRGSAKSHSFARALVLQANWRPLRVLGAREIQNSIRDSVKRLLDDVINEAGLTWHGRPFYESLDTEIRGLNGSLFTFAGVRTNPDKIKSSEGLDIVWLAEANRISEQSLTKIRPTLRSPDSEIWAEWNPESPKDPIDKMFRLNGRPRTEETGLPPRSIARQVSWRNNEFFPDVLREEMEFDYARDPDLAAHVWGGAYRTMSDAQVFKNWRQERFDTPPDARFYFGGDWGFARDPAVLIRCWMRGKTLYVDREAWGLHVDIDHLPALFAGSDWQQPARWSNPAPERFKGIPGATRWTIRCDSARPETISYLRKYGFNTVAARKGPNSIVEGVEFLKTMDIVVHPDHCPHTVDELSSYSYKIDERSQEVLPQFADKKNHTIDALRYALEDQRRGSSFVTVVQGLVR